MKKLLCLLAASSMMLPTFAKSPNPLCNGIEDSEFSIGDGSREAPFLLCNTAQFQHIANDESLWRKDYELGQDLSFKEVPFKPIGKYDIGYQGHFNGHGYTMSNITINDPTISSHLGVFARIDYAEIKNLNINNFHITDWPYKSSGALAGEAHYSQVVNVHARNIKSKAPDDSGGLVGKAIYSHLFNVSASGYLETHFGSGYVGGLVGNTRGSSIQLAYTNIFIENLSRDPYGTKFIGGLVGYLRESKVTDAYALGKITLVNQPHSNHFSRYFGGITGAIYQSQLIRTFAAVNMENLVIPSMGGAVGELFSSTVDNVYFDKEVAGISFSSAGDGLTTEKMKTSAHWLSKGFSTKYWLIKEGVYPTLKHQPDIYN